MATIKVKRKGVDPVVTGGSPDKLLKGELAIGNDYLAWANEKDAADGNGKVNVVLAARLNKSNVFSEDNTFHGGDLVLKAAATKTITFVDSGNNTKYTFGANGKFTTAHTEFDSDMLVSKAYVDARIQGLNIKSSVRAASNVGQNINLASGVTVPISIGGVNIGLEERFLLKNQTTASQNGIYEVYYNDAYGGNLIRRVSDANDWIELVSAFVFVEEGTNADTGWVCTVDKGGTLETTPVTWSQFSGAGTYTASTGLIKVGNDFRINNTVTAAAQGLRPIAISAQGLITGYGDVVSTLPNPESLIISTNGTTLKTYNGANPIEVDFVGGTDIGVTGNSTLNTVTVNHGSFSTTTSWDNANSYNFLTGLTVGSNGHVTGINRKVLTAGDGISLTTGSITPLQNMRISIKGASAEETGGIRIGFESPGNPNLYPLLVGTAGDNALKAYVNVPWTDTTYSAATSSVLGLVKLGSNTIQTIAMGSPSAAASRTYPIQNNSSGQLVVNVPWENQNTVTAIGADSSTKLTGNITLASGTNVALSQSGSIITFNATDTKYSAATSSTLGLVKTGATGLGSKQYAVQLNGSDQMFVSVPWQNDIYTLPTPTSTLFNFYEGTGALNLSAWNTTKAGGFDTTSNFPSATNRLNYGGYLYATKMYATQFHGLIDGGSWT